MSNYHKLKHLAIKHLFTRPYKISFTKHLSWIVFELDISKHKNYSVLTTSRTFLSSRIAQVLTSNINILITTYDYDLIQPVTKLLMGKLGPWPLQFQKLYIGFVFSRLNVVVSWIWPPSSFGHYSWPTNLVKWNNCHILTWRSKRKWGRLKWHFV
jgi:hypothetical protein